MRDKQFKKLLEDNTRLVSLGCALVSSMKSYGKFSRKGMSDNMRVAIAMWEENLRDHYTVIPEPRRNRC